MPELTLVEPTTVAEAVAALRADGSRPIAGGTALVQALKQGLHDVSTLVSLRRVRGLAAIRAEANELVIGATATLWDVAASPAVRAGAPGLAEAVGAVGNVRIRSMGTLGGNLCYADPHCDPPIALLALGAAVVVEGPEGRRRIRLDDYFVGYYETAQAPGELLVEIRVPRPAPDTRAAFLRYTFTSEDDWPCVAVAAAARVQNGVLHELRLAVAGVADRPVLVGASQRPLTGADAPSVAQVAASRCAPVSDLRGSEGYKREMVRVHVRRAIERLARSTPGKPGVRGGPGGLGGP
jgi:carbon-monoxide dehydrogenase medium subunit